ncbi:hypothetical protein M405DRAFT_932880 [Rhizopogon salebrosus TDB-379]|nr:hypothetical protein M405DRAFT_932880 [Rhizopogon salebrosus TDB-379]
MVDTDNAKSKRVFKKLFKNMSDMLDKEKDRVIRTPVPAGSNECGSPSASIPLLAHSRLHQDILMSHSHQHQPQPAPETDTTPTPTHSFTSLKPIVALTPTRTHTPSPTSHARQGPFQQEYIYQPPHPSSADIVQHEEGHYRAMGWRVDAAFLVGSLWTLVLERVQNLRVPEPLKGT